MPHPYVLDKDEVTIAQQAVSDYNTSIASICAERNIPVVDINSVLSEASSGHGLMLAGLSLNTDFLTGYLMSLDGVHPTDLGYAVIANEFIATINKAFDAFIPLIDIYQYIQDTQPVATEKNFILKSNVEFKHISTLFGGKIK